LALDYLLTCAGGTHCGGYVAAVRTLTQPVPADELRFTSRTIGPVQLVVRVLDESGQTLQYRPPLDGADPQSWRHVAIKLDQPEYFQGGAASGHPEGAIKQLSILATDPTRTPAVGSVMVDDIVLRWTPPTK
jgi:hypothetical protein